MCSACGGTCGNAAPRRSPRTTIDVNAGTRKIRLTIQRETVKAAERRA